MSTNDERMQTAVDRTGRFRIVAAEAHSWASLLLEDESGRFHLHHVGANATTAVSSEIAKSLLESRAYRVWRGDQSWNVLERLLVLSGVNSGSPANTVPFVSGVPSDELHSV
jgi:hypothetical protein